MKTKRICTILPGLKTTGKLAGKIVQTNNLVKEEEGNILTKED